MKIEELRSKTVDQLKTMILDSKKELMNLRFQLVSGALTNSSRIKYVRRLVAKIKTILVEQTKK